MTAAAFSIDGVSKRFRGTVALERVSFEVPYGSIFGLLGPNGAGKTTLMRILVGIFGPDEGKVTIGGSSGRSLKERIGYLPEERGLYPNMKTRDFLQYFAAMKGIRSDAVAEAVELGIDRVGIREHAEKKLEALSKGNQQRVQLLVTLIHQPDILILDEPFTGLDPIGVDQMKDILIEETERGACVIVSTHLMERAEQLCENIGLIHRGRVLQSGNLEALRRAEGRDRVVIRYEGTQREDWRPQSAGVVDVAHENHCVRLELQPGAPIPEILREAAVALDIVEATQTRSTLHDIFVRLVGGEEQAS